MTSKMIMLAAMPLAIAGASPRAASWHTPDEVLPLVPDFELDGEIGEWRELPVRYGAADRRYDVCAVKSPVPEPAKGLWLDWVDPWE